MLYIINDLNFFFLFLGNFFIIVLYRYILNVDFLFLNRFVRKCSLKFEILLLIWIFCVNSLRKSKSLRLKFNVSLVKFIMRFRCGVLSVRVVVVLVLRLLRS